MRAARVASAALWAPLIPRRRLGGCLCLGPPIHQSVGWQVASRLWVGLQACCSRFSAAALARSCAFVLSLHQTGPGLPGSLPGEAAKDSAGNAESRPALFSRAAPRRNIDGGCRGRRSWARLAPTRPRHVLGMPCAHQPLGTGCPRAEARSTTTPRPPVSHITWREVGGWRMEVGGLVARVSNQMHVLFCIDCISGTAQTECHLVICICICIASPKHG